ncbi:MAG: hypothetical protein Q9159_006300 [Coniocarpon cinnabarinum]
MDANINMENIYQQCVSFEGHGDLSGNFECSANDLSHYYPPVATTDMSFAVDSIDSSLPCSPLETLSNADTAPSHAGPSTPSTTQGSLALPPWPATFHLEAPWPANKLDAFRMDETLRGSSTPCIQSAPDQPEYSFNSLGTVPSASSVSHMDCSEINPAITPLDTSPWPLSDQSGLTSSASTSTYSIVPLSCSSAEAPSGYEESPSTLHSRSPRPNKNNRRRRITASPGTQSGTRKKEIDCPWAKADRSEKVCDCRHNGKRCQGKFKRGEHLKRHQRTHLKPEEKRKFFCPFAIYFGDEICPKGHIKPITERSDNMSQHLATHIYGHSVNPSRNPVVHRRIIEAVILRDLKGDKARAKVRKQSVKLALRKHMENSATPAGNRNLGEAWTPKCNAHIDHDTMRELFPDGFVSCEDFERNRSKLLTGEHSRGWYRWVDVKVPWCMAWCKGGPKPSEQPMTLSMVGLEKLMASTSPARAVKSPGFGHRRLTLRTSKL